MGLKLKFIFWDCEIIFMTGPLLIQMATTASATINIQNQRGDAVVAGIEIESIDCMNPSLKPLVAKITVILVEPGVVPANNQVDLRTHNQECSNGSKWLRKK